ncbi:MAG: response regulator transcription factor [Anaerolineales bacterium]|jgi:DNA-binding NarL/FixJ family response regulator
MSNQDISNKATKKVLVIDDQILFREGLESLLSSTTDFVMVGCAGTVHEGCEQATLFKPDIILMDFSLPDGTGLDATRAILAHVPDCKIVFLTVHESDENLFAALRLGAKGYMLKNIGSNELLASLRALDRGEEAVSRKMVSRIVEEFARSPQSKSEDDRLLVNLSPRELDVIREMESGATNLEIAQRLYLSVNTVKHHIRNIMGKLGLKNRHQIASFARKNGLVGKFPTSKEN